MLTYYIPHTIVASSQPQAPCPLGISRLQARISTPSRKCEAAGTSFENPHTNLRTGSAAAMNDIATKKGAIPLKPASRRRPTQAEAEEAVRTLIAWAGDDPAR